MSLELHFEAWLEPIRSGDTVLVVASTSAAKPADIRGRCDPAHPQTPFRQQRVATE